MPGTRVRNRSTDSVPILPVPAVPGKAPTWVRKTPMGCGKTAQQRLCQSPSPRGRAECLRLCHPPRCWIPPGAVLNTLRGTSFSWLSCGDGPPANVGGECLSWAPTFASGPIPQFRSPWVPPNPTGSPAAFPRPPALSFRGLGRWLILSFPLPDTPTFLSATRQCGQG